MKTTRFLGFALGVVATLTATAFGQGFGHGMMGMRQQRAPGENIAKLFGRNTAFTADATIFTQKPNDKPVPTMEFSYAMLDGKVRTEMDMAKSHADLSDDERAMMEQMGMSRIVHVIVPEKKITYAIYPAMKAYCVVPSTQTNVQSEATGSKIERTELGKETVEGHPGVKSKVVVTDADGKTTESIQWQATDLKDFPIRSETTAANGLVSITLFRNINLSKPSASLFEPPADYQRYNSMQELMMSNMQRMMPPGGEMPERGPMHQRPGSME